MQLVEKILEPRVAERVNAAKVELARERAEIIARYDATQRQQIKDINKQTDAKIRMGMEEAFAEGMRCGFTIARKDRFTETFNDISVPQYDIRAALRPGREIARGLEQNNPYGRRALDLSVSNVIGPKGFKLQMDVRNDDDTADELANKFILKKFETFTRKENASLDGEMSFRMMCQYLYRSKRRDGEALCREVEGGPYGIQLECLDPEILDETYTADLTNGNTVIQGVEFDKNWRKVGFWLRSAKAGTTQFFLSNSGERSFVPAEKMYHFFRRSYARQARGVTEFSPVAIELKALMRWITSSTRNALGSSMLMGFIQSTLQGTMPFTGDTKAGDGTTNPASPDGSKAMYLEDGTIRELPNGKQFQGFDPKFPSDQHDPFVRSMLRGIAVGWGASYSDLSGDYSQANYSSDRADKLSIREYYQNEQEDFKEAFLDRFFPRWLRAAALAGQFQWPSGKMLPVFSKFDKFNAGIWVPRRWSWVDPLKDILAAVMSIEYGLSSATQIISEDGGNIVDVYNDLADEDALRKTKGIVVKFDQLRADINAAQNPVGNTQAKEKAARSFLSGLLEIVTELTETEIANDARRHDEAMKRLVEHAKKLTNGHAHLVN